MRDDLTKSSVFIKPSSSAQREAVNMAQYEWTHVGRFAYPDYKWEDWRIPAFLTKVAAVKEYMPLPYAECSTKRLLAIINSNLMGWLNELFAQDVDNVDFLKERGKMLELVKNCQLQSLGEGEDFIKEFEQQILFQHCLVEYLDLAFVGMVSLWCPEYCLFTKKIYEEMKTMMSSTEKKTEVAMQYINNKILAKR